MRLFIVVYNDRFALSFVSRYRHFDGDRKWQYRETNDKYKFQFEQNDDEKKTLAHETTGQ